MATVRELWRFPVKSMGGERVETLKLTPSGAVGDRLFAIQQKKDGRLLTARLEPRLLWARARLLGEVAHIALPDGTVLSSAAPGVDRVLSSWLGQEVTLIRAQPGRADVTHLIPVSAEIATYMKGNPATTGVFTRATVAHHADLGPVLEWSSPGAGFSDGGTIHILSERQLNRLRRSTEAQGWSARRFRPNLVVGLVRNEADEDAWLEHDIQVGSTVMRPTERCIRCVLATRSQPGLADDPRILTGLRSRAARLGIYADVVSGGEIRRGQPMEVGASRSHRSVSSGRA
ncbi:MAG: MOSC domain-containing protein [Candidatus Dormibacteria bacterium]